MTDLSNSPLVEKLDHCRERLRNLSSIINSKFEYLDLISHLYHISLDKNLELIINNDLLKILSKLERFFTLTQEYDENTKLLPKSRHNPECRFYLDKTNKLNNELEAFKSKYKMSVQNYSLISHIEIKYFLASDALNLKFDKNTDSNKINCLIFKNK
jgi:hypothetical protein